MTPLPPDAPRAAAGSTRVRYAVLAMTILMSAITYLDRVCISVTAPEMQRDLGLSTVQMSFVFSAFTLAYALFEIPTGRWGDRAGTRRVLTRIVMWWSTFTMLTAGAFSYASLLVTRFLFGIGEAGAWPNVAITLARWFPVRERGRAQGLFFTGAHVAGGLTPFLVRALVEAGFTWRELFVMFGAVGFIWAIGWYMWFRDNPREHRHVNAAERDYIERERLEGAADVLSLRQWIHLFANRTVTFLCLMYFTQVYGFFLYITWMPTYLEKSRGFESYRLGIFAGMPLMFCALADVFGGLTTDAITRRFGLRTGRMAIGSVSLASAGVFIIAGTFVANPYWAIVWLSLAAGSSCFLLAAAWGACVDIGGPHSGVIGGAMNGTGAIGGFLSPLVVGYAVQYAGSWNGPLYFTGVLYLLGALCWRWIDPTKRVALPTAA